MSRGAREPRQRGGRWHAGAPRHAARPRPSRQSRRSGESRLRRIALDVRGIARPKGAASRGGFGVSARDRFSWTPPATARRWIAPSSSTTTRFARRSRRDGGGGAVAARCADAHRAERSDCAPPFAAAHSLRADGVLRRQVGFGGEVFHDSRCAGGAGEERIGRDARFSVSRSRSCNGERLPARGTPRRAFACSPTSQKGRRTPTITSCIGFLDARIALSRPTRERASTSTPSCAVPAPAQVLRTRPEHDLSASR